LNLEDINIDEELKKNSEEEKFDLKFKKEIGKDEI
jgi:hypothetical protein